MVLGTIPKMPQIFQVLRCYKCLVFQVHQTKKSNKWECKLCGAKQSVKRHYGIGTAKDCRQHVQQLNCLRGEIDELKETLPIDTEDADEVLKAPVPPKKSKWSEFVDKTVEVEDNEAASDSKMYLGDAEVVLEVKKKRNNFKCPVLKTENSGVDSGGSNIKSHKNRTEQPIFQKTEKILTEEHKSNYNTNNSTSITEPHSNKIFHKSEHNLVESKLDIVKPLQTNNRTVPKPIVPPPVKSDSKWAQYVEDDELNDVIDDNEVAETDYLTLGDQSQGKRNLQGLFALCNDEDLDSVLDI